MTFNALSGYRRRVPRRDVWGIAVATALTLSLVPGIAQADSETGSAASSGTTFAPGRLVPVTLCGVSPTAEAIAHGDFDGDGRVDLVVTDECGFGIQMLRGNGDGTFAAPRYIPTGVAPDAVTAVDLDGDGHLDLIVSNAIGEMVILYGDGLGGFADQRRYFAQGLAPGAIRAGDFDHDGHLDFAVAATPSTVFLADGARGFIGHTVAAGLASVGLETADLDGDGNLDLIVASGVPVVLNALYGDGHGGFGRNQTLLGPDLVQEAIRSADVNNDGHPDVVGVTSLGGLNVWLNDGHGTLLASRYSYASPGTAGLALADLYGTGNLDMITADSVTAHITLWRGDGHGGFTRTEWYPAPFTLESTELIDLRGTGQLDLVTAPMIGPYIAVYLRN
ncbi:FG-GAP repeat domain-containing protein [Nocardia sp. NPDC056100]|uniref:FG-GAP repeat domain-containing protein n=1 Tax=Nocardia sp. NPDC056100 TaxID=3345712 RepID=UPI0035DEEF8A